MEMETAISIVHRQSTPGERGSRDLLAWPRPPIDLAGGERKGQCHWHLGPERSSRRTVVGLLGLGPEILVTVLTVTGSRLREPGFRFPTAQLHTRDPIASCTRQKPTTESDIETLLCIQKHPYDEPLMEIKVQTSTGLIERVLMTRLGHCKTRVQAVVDPPSSDKATVYS
eukprot:3940933-Rhodomonas_salina.3